MTTHRTRQRRRDDSTPPPGPDQAERDLQELLVLWPRLEAALARDGAGPSAAPSGPSSSPGNGSPAVVDLDTQEVLTLIEVAVDKLAAEAAPLLGITPADRVLGRLRDAGRRARAHRAEALAELAALRAGVGVKRTELETPASSAGEPHEVIRAALVRTAAAERDLARAIAEARPQAEKMIQRIRDVDDALRQLTNRAARVEQRRSTQGVLEQLPLWYAQLRDRKQPLADHIADDARTWCRQARLVLRLQTREIPLGYLCPDHRLEAPTELIRDRDQAELAESLRAGRSLRAGERPLVWRYAESVHCPRCRAKWTGVLQLRQLMKMIDQVEEDEMVRDKVLTVVRDMAAQNTADGHEAPLWRYELALLAAIGAPAAVCAAGCGCRRATNDPDRLDCACDGPCSMDDAWNDVELALPESLRA